LNLEKKHWKELTTLCKKHHGLSCTSTNRKQEGWWLEDSAHHKPLFPHFIA